MCIRVGQFQHTRKISKGKKRNVGCALHQDRMRGEKRRKKKKRKRPYIARKIILVFDFRKKKKLHTIPSHRKKKTPPARNSEQELLAGKHAKEDWKEKINDVQENGNENLNNRVT